MSRNIDEIRRDNDDRKRYWWAVPRYAEDISQLLGSLDACHAIIRTYRERKMQMGTDELFFELVREYLADGRNWTKNRMAILEAAGKLDAHVIQGQQANLSQAAEQFVDWKRGGPRPPWIPEPKESEAGDAS